MSNVYVCVYTSLTYTVLATIEPSYLYISLSLFSHLATLVLYLLSPPLSSSLQILIVYFVSYQPISGISLLFPVVSLLISLLHKHLPHFTHNAINSCSSLESVLPSTTHSLFHSKHTTYIFHKSFPLDCWYLTTVLTISGKR